MPQLTVNQLVAGLSRSVPPRDCFWDASPARGALKNYVINYVIFYFIPGAAGRERKGVGKREFPVWGDPEGQEGGSPIGSEASEIVLPAEHQKIT